MTIARHYNDGTVVTTLWLGRNNRTAIEAFFSRHNYNTEGSEINRISFPDNEFEEIRY